jgi:hypothetical protein
VRYCKCRPRSDERLRYENAIVEALSNDPSLARIIPRTRGAEDGEFRTQVSEYVPGVRFESMLRRMSPATWKTSTLEILTAACLVADRAPAMVPLLQRPADRISPLDAASEALAQLASWETDPATLGVLKAVLQRTPPLPRSPQHGDLWPANVLRWGSDWWILDFEVFGKVEIPMYDAYHLIRTAMATREATGEAIPWLDRMAQQDAATHCCRDVIRHMVGHYGISREQAIAAAVFYSVHIAATFRASKKRSSLWKPLMVEVDRIATYLREGPALDRLILGPP